MEIEYQERLELWTEIKVRDLIGKVMSKVHGFRPCCSRNTVRLSIQEGPTTPTRQRIIETAQQVLHEATTESAKVQENA